MWIPCLESWDCAAVQTKDLTLVVLVFCGLPIN